MLIDELQDYRAMHRELSQSRDNGNKYAEMFIYLVENDDPDDEEVDKALAAIHSLWLKSKI